MRQHTAEEAYRHIDNEILAQVLDHFRSRQADYTGGPAFMLLGSKGQFSDINRKFWKLYASMWEEKELQGEQPEEILMDFVGHCLLSIYCLRMERGDYDLIPFERGN